MQFQQKKVAIALAVALGVGSSMFAALPAWAADIKVDITGSNIRQLAREGDSQIVTLTRESIERQGFQTVTEALQSINQAGAGLDDRFTNGFAPSGGGVNLRNLGFNSTLVLVNGRRLPTFPFAQILGTPQGFNDVNSIPVAAIDHIDVLLDGASAIYGADAVAGVINVILRSNYAGFEASASYGISSQGDGNTPQVSVAWGTGDLTKDKYNVFLNGTYFKRDEVFTVDRNFAKTEDLRFAGSDRRSSYGTPGTLTDTETGAKVYLPGCGPSTQIGGSSIRSGFCRFDRPATGTGLLPETERYGFFGSGQYNFSEEVQAFIEGSWARNNYYSHGFAAPTLDGINGTGAGLILMAGNPYNPFPNDAELRLRTVDVGTRDTQAQSDIWRIVAGLKGNVKGWDWEAAYYQSEVNSDVQNLNQVLQTTFQQYLDAGKYNINNPYANPASVTDALRYTAPRTGKSTMKDGAAKISGDLYPLPAGPLAMALGVEYRQESLSDTPDAELASGNTMGISASNAYGSRNVTSVFAEFNIPIVKTLEANLAARYDSYSGNGSFNGTSPKLGLRWQPNAQWLVRGTVGQAYRAPSLFETTPASQTAYFFGAQDPVQCPVFNETNPACLEDLKRITVGNPNLKPEKTNFITGGVIFEPVPRVSFGVDYWYFDRKDEISALPDQTLINIFANDPRIVVRNAAGQIAYFNSVPVNLNKTMTNGLDFTITAAAPVQDWGQLSGKMGLTYVITYDIQVADDTGQLVKTQLNGTWEYPRVRATWELDWVRGPWNATLSGYYTGSQNQGPGTTPNIGPYTIWNLSAGYTGIKNWNFRASVSNLFNRPPQFVDYTTGSQGGYDPTIADPMGTFFNLTATYTWK